MGKVLTVTPAILMLLWPILGASAGSDYFYNSVTPAADERATEKPLAVLPDCFVPSQTPTQFMLEALTVAYEVDVNGTVGSLMWRKYEFCFQQLVDSDYSFRSESKDQICHSKHYQSVL